MLAMPSTSCKTPGQRAIAYNQVTTVISVKTYESTDERHQNVGGLGNFPVVEPVENGNRFGSCLGDVVLDLMGHERDGITKRGELVIDAVQMGKANVDYARIR